MANRSRNSSPTASLSSRTSNSPPPSHSRRLAPMPVAVPEDQPSPSRSLGSTPSHQPIDLPRLPAASKGGCWTCRLRRKKCDEQREGGSCRTCRRLTIDCLGWGAKRPEWMRDKRAVEAYKAEIKAKLTRAGLIRGQPRTTFRSQNTTPVIPSQTRPAPYHRASAPDISTSSASSSSSQHFQQLDYDYHQFMPSLPGQHHRQSQDSSMIPGVPGASNSGFQQLSDYSDSSLHALDLHTPFYQYPPSVTPISSSTDSLSIDFPTFGVPHEHSPFGFDSPNPQISVVPTPDQQPSFDNEYVLYYFEHVRREHMFFAGTTFTNATYSMISQDPQGPVMKAVCALASSHLTKSRIAQGLETPDASNGMHATYCLQEAVFLIDKARQLRGTYTEGEALAALLLIGYTQITGGEYDWRSSFSVMSEWLDGTGLLRQEDPVTTYLTLTVTTQLLVKATLSLDLFTSIATGKSPRYHVLSRALLGEQGRLWTRNDGEAFNALQLDLLTGCPNEVMVALVDIAMLSQWRTEEARNRTLSYRELVRRAEEIERRLRHQDLASFPVEVKQAPLHPTLAMQLTAPDQASLYPSEGIRRLVGQLHNEAAMLLLNTIISNQNPGVLEISSSIGNIIQLLERLAPSEIDRAIIFPLCLAGCLSDDMNRRTFFQRRLLHVEGGFRNSMQLQQAIETVWHQRDVVKDTIDFRQVVRGQSLLLV